MRLSAHRGGVGDDPERQNTREAFEHATGLGVAFVEFDVQRTADGQLVLFHDDEVVDQAGRSRPVGELTYSEFTAITGIDLLYDEALALLAGRAGAHIDLKFASPQELHADPESTWEVAAIRRAVEVLGTDAIIVSTLEDASVKSIRAWARDEYPELLVGLTLGRGMRGAAPLDTLRVRYGELFPSKRLASCDANLIVAHSRLARLRLARFAKRNELPLVVWTVDEARYLRRWSRDPRVWMVTTNYPERMLRDPDDRGRR